MVSWYGVDTYVNYKLLAVIILICDLVLSWGYLGLLGMMIDVVFGSLGIASYAGTGRLGLNLVSWTHSLVLLGTAKFQAFMSSHVELTRMELCFVPSPVES